MPPDRQTGRHFLFHFFKEDFFHENPFPTPAQHGTGAEYAADLPARFGFRRKYPPPTMARRSLTATALVQRTATPILTA